VTVEVFELKIPLIDAVALQCRQPNLEGSAEIELRRLVKEALRMRPSRIVRGDRRRCRGEVTAADGGGQRVVHAAAEHPVE
jgi:Flp pilus assembly CpaF family ATPase